MPAIKLGHIVEDARPGDVVVATADCPAFERNVRDLCRGMRKTLVDIKDVGDETKRVEIRL